MCFVIGGPLGLELDDWRMGSSSPLETATAAPRQDEVGRAAAEEAHRGNKILLRR